MLYSLRVQIYLGSGKKEEIKEDRDGKFLCSIMTTVSVKKWKFGIPVLFADYVGMA